MLGKAERCAVAELHEVEEWLSVLLSRLNLRQNKDVA